MSDELNNYIDTLNSEHSYFIQEWCKTNDIPGLDNYISHLTENEKDALLIFLIIKFMEFWR